MLKLFYTLQLLLPIIAGAQTTEALKTSIGSGAAQTSANKYIIASIIGQPSPISHLKHSSVQLLQGFQHPLIIEVQNNKYASAIDVFPNPTRDGRVTLTWREDVTNGKVTITLVDLFGRRILTQHAYRASGRLSCEFPQVASALYHLEIVNADNQTHYAKVFFE